MTEAQISAAVSAAYDPTATSTRQEAYTFLETVKLRRLETWPSCLNLFLSGSEVGNGTWQWTYNNQTRMFGLAVLDDVLTYE